MKFYTPSIDEFHHGMLYQELVDNEWKPMKFKLNILPDIFDTRIKYLDEEDITELGFRFERKTRYGKIFIKEVMSVSSIGFVELHFVVRSGEPFVSLFQDEMPIFSEINIKNISELKWLMTRYGLV